MFLHCEHVRTFSRAAFASSAAHTLTYFQVAQAHLQTLESATLGVLLLLLLGNLRGLATHLTCASQRAVNLSHGGLKVVDFFGL